MRSFALPRSTTARFVVLALLVLTLSNAAVLAVAARIASRSLSDELVEIVRAQASSIASIYARDGAAGAAAAVEAELAEAPQQVMLLEGPGGQRLAGNAQGWPPTLTAPARWQEVELFTVNRRTPVLFGIITVRLDATHRLLVGHGLTERARLARGLSEAAYGAITLSVLVSILGAWALSRFLENRVRDAADTARDVATGDLSRRAPIVGSGDAFDELAGALNTMLSRIEALVAELRLVTDSLAHHLRSPLSRIKSRIERATSDPDPKAARDALTAVATELDGLLRILTVALDLSRAEAGIGREAFSPFDLRELIEDVIELYAPVAEERNVALDAEAPEPILVRGHKELFAQALSNLVDNALKHSGGVHLRVAARRADQRAVLTVTDDGVGIPAAEHGRALARFSRLDAARTSPGSGLGLSLVGAIIRMHDGSLALEDAVPGLRVSISLPEAASLTPPAAAAR